MAFPVDVKERALVACARHCSICHRFCGLKLELHHIELKSEGGADTYENCIPLCFDCHGDMRSYDHKHPKGTKYSASELKKHRDSWYAKVASTPIGQYTPESQKLDASIFNEFKLILPWQGAINWLRTNNFAGFSYRRKKLEQLDAFVDRCEDPSFEFLDAELEALRADLCDKLGKLLYTLSMNTFTSGPNLEFAGVPQDWELTNPQRFDEVVSLIHREASEAVSAYDALLRAGRRKLGIP